MWYIQIEGLSVVEGKQGAPGFNGTKGEQGPPGPTGPQGPSGSGNFSTCQYKVESGSTHLQDTISIVVNKVQPDVSIQYKARFSKIGSYQRYSANYFTILLPVILCLTLYMIACKECETLVWDTVAYFNHRVTYSKKKKKK